MNNDELIVKKNNLIEEIEKKLNEYDSKKDYSRNFAIGIKLITAILGATVTVLLGWETTEEYKTWLKNFALICGAVVAVMNTIDSFGSYSARWINYKAAYLELIFLQSEVENERDLDKLENHDKKLREIIMDAKKSSLDLRRQKSS